MTTETRSRWPTAARQSRWRRKAGGAARELVQQDRVAREEARGPEERRAVAEDEVRIEKDAAQLHIFLRLNEEIDVGGDEWNRRVANPKDPGWVLDLPAKK